VSDPTTTTAPAEHRPSLLAELLAQVLTLPVLIMALTAAATVGISHYRLEQAETDFKTHVAEGKEQRRMLDDHIARIEGELRASEKNHGDRLLVLEERYTEIRGLLAEIKTAVAEQGRRARERER
jgi:hypothetical protein